MKSNFNEIINSETPVLVDFYAEWCGPCKTLISILEEVKSELGDAIKIIKIDVDKNHLLATNYRVKSVPTLVLFNDGNQVWRQSGVLQKGDLIKVLQSH
ncbi:thioredoxin [Gelidibacter pelagius]|uniref:Thioredoxin n=1 Tax=Gelidibacter pelagius TaxID=2819985 RepID=A0ABS3SSC0_9FLAO|nr:thioredoxin [Gelidibacter pelagius]MBO3098594.1 thioredoxin [Gelidibacter pelagius]